MGMTAAAAALGQLADQLDDAVATLRVAVSDLGADDPLPITSADVGYPIGADAEGDQVFWCTMCDAMKYEGRSGGSVTLCRRNHPDHVRRVAWLR